MGATMAMIMGGSALIQSAPFLQFYMERARLICCGWVNRFHLIRRSAV